VEAEMEKLAKEKELLEEGLEKLCLSGSTEEVDEEEQDQSN
jgi:hypothetical protein